MQVNLRCTGLRQRSLEGHTDYDCILNIRKCQNIMEHEKSWETSAKEGGRKSQGLGSLLCACILGFVESARTVYGRTVFGRKIETPPHKGRKNKSRKNETLKNAQPNL